ncbi:hypothetical protein [Flavobacterium agrisoli]|nr:hypothetical protein [Flavobacterium agrisoli]
MNTENYNNQPKGLSLLKKIGVGILILMIIVYYVLSIRFLLS